MLNGFVYTNYTLIPYDTERDIFYSNVNWRISCTMPISDQMPSDVVTPFIIIVQSSAQKLKYSHTAITQFVFNSVSYIVGVQFNAISFCTKGLYFCGIVSWIIMAKLRTFSCIHIGNTQYANEIMLNQLLFITCCDHSVWTWKNFENFWRIQSRIWRLYSQFHWYFEKRAKFRTKHPTNANISHSEVINIIGINWNKRIDEGNLPLKF